MKVVFVFLFFGFLLTPASAQNVRVRAIVYASMPGNLPDNTKAPIRH